LTLKDAEIGEDSEDDELENLELRENAKLQERLELKKRKPVYNPNDIDETGKNSLLAQYDEEIDGKAEHVFTLDGSGSTREQKQKKVEDAEKRKMGVVISLEDLKDDKPVSDYLEPKQIKIKKSKKSKKSKSTRQKDFADDDIFTANDDSPQVDVLQVQSKKRTYDDANFVDDDDLQSRLAEQRRQALKKNRVKAADLARQIREEEENAMDGVEEIVEEGGLVLDATSEFVANIQLRNEDEEPPLSKSSPPKRSQSEEAGPEPESDDDVDMDKPADSHEPQESTTPAQAETNVTATGLDEEESISKGVGSTLAMLRQRRLIEEGHDGLNNKFVDHQKFLGEKQKREEAAERRARLQRENDRKSGRFDHMSARDREENARHTNQNREQADSRALADLFNREYKPNFEIKHTDDHGRTMGPKEAFKELSHQFHGKGSGKQKHEKRLKKIAEEKKRESMSTLDSSSHLSSSAMGNKAKKNQQAGVRLQ
jgi:U4/U6.U5 tri-snRNP-associated protein 1